MNWDDYPGFPRRRAAATMALDRAVDWAARGTQLVALSLAVASVASTATTALGAGYGAFGFQGAAMRLVPVVGALLAFLLLRRLFRVAARTLVALGLVPATAAVEVLVERWVYGSAMQASWSPGLWPVLGRTLLYAALLFPAVYLFAATLALIVTVAVPEAYLDEDLRSGRGGEEGTR